MSILEFGMESGDFKISASQIDTLYFKNFMSKDGEVSPSGLVLSRPRTLTGRKRDVSCGAMHREICSIPSGRLTGSVIHSLFQGLFLLLLPLLFRHFTGQLMN